jgi:carboxypeptidase Taq
LQLGKSAAPADAVRFAAVNEKYAELKRRLAEIHDVGKAGGILSWDQQTQMPPRGAAVRAEQLATLGRIAHEKFTSPEIGKLLDDLEGFEESQPYDSVEASLVRVVRRDWHKACKVPADLRAEMTRAASLALPVWVEARELSDFAMFLPELRKNMELRHRYVECFEPEGDPYDVLLDDFERDMKTSEVREVFDVLKAGQIPLVAAIAERKGTESGPALDGPFPVERQKEFELEVVKRFGYDPEAWRIDTTVHPFASNGGIDDIRITTRYFEHNLDGLFATMHECGHGLYEHGISKELERTPLARGTSLGMHESQSRMWENLVGRSLPFWNFFFPQLQETFPEPLRGLSAEEWYRHVNDVKPSLIRVEADEATYNLHIILRFEMEQEILARSIDLEDLPEAWNERMRGYLGIDVPEDRLGILQDMHWAGGHIGYFPTYALGNVISAQLWEKITDEIPDLHDQFEQGEFTALREWLTERLYAHGRKFTPKEMLERVVGGPIDPQPYVRYLQDKLGGIYGLSAATPG